MLLHIKAPGAGSKSCYQEWKHKKRSPVLHRNIQKCSPEVEQLNALGIDIQLPQYTHKPTPIFLLLQFPKFSGFKQQPSSYYFSHFHGSGIQEVLGQEILIWDLCCVAAVAGWHFYLCSLEAFPCSLPGWTSLGFLPTWLPRSSPTIDCGWGSRVSAPAWGRSCMAFSDMAFSHAASLLPYSTGNK